MPITKQAIKRMKQNETAQARNRHYKSRMKSMVKLILTYIQKGEGEKAKKVQAEVMKAIDTAAKKNIIHKNNASRKKSRIQKALATGKVESMAKPSSKNVIAQVETKGLEKEVGKVETKEEMEGDTVETGEEKTEDKS